MTAETEKGPLTNRGYEAHMSRLGISLSMLEGTVLGLGSGKDAEFEVEVNKRLAEQAEKNPRKPKSFMVPFSYHYSKEGKEPRNKGEVVPSIAGEFKQLPFADGTFDSVVSLGAFPYFGTRLPFGTSNAPSPEAVEDFAEIISEIHRVLKSGGMCRLTPVTNVVKKTEMGSMIVLELKVVLDTFFTTTVEYNDEGSAILVLKKR